MNLDSIQVNGRNISFEEIKNSSTGNIEITALLNQALRILYVE